MSYSFRIDDADVQSGLRRIALDQIDSGLAEIDDTAMPRAERIHQVRKRCKKIRGLVRLVRPVFPDYKFENTAFRDAARSLSDVRDAGALVETCDRIDVHFDEVLYKAALRPIRETFAARAKAREEADDLDDRIAGLREALSDARVRAVGWTLTADGPEAWSGGLAKTFGRARAAMADAKKEPTGEVLHAWRKRVKYHWYHARLLKGINRDLMAPHVDLADSLSDVLGDHHDLHVMEGELDGLDAHVDATRIEAFRALLVERRRALEVRAFDLGELLLSEPPKGIAARLTGYWGVWQAGVDREMVASG